MFVRKEPFVPAHLLILDGMGALLLGLGLAKYIADIDILPEVLRFENYDIAFVLGGIAFMCPAIFHIISNARNRNSRDFHGQ